MIDKIILVWILIKKSVLVVFQVEKIHGFENRAQNTDLKSKMWYTNNVGKMCKLNVVLLHYRLIIIIGVQIILIIILVIVNFRTIYSNPFQEYLRPSFPIPVQKKNIILSPRRRNFVNSEWAMCEGCRRPFGVGPGWFGGTSWHFSRFIVIALRTLMKLLGRRTNCEQSASDQNGNIYQDRRIQATRAVGLEKVGKCRNWKM